MLPSLGAERQETYSPFMPIDAESGIVIDKGVKGVNKEKGTVIYVDGNGVEKEVSVAGGNCKLQWKIDFGARWYSLDVDYEIYGKDHQPNEKIYRRVCEILGGVPPVNFTYEMFLSDTGEKISKSKGNGITIDEWLEVAPQESLRLFMYQKPRTAKRLFFEVIPKNVDEYIRYIKSYQTASELEKTENPAYFIHSGDVPNFDLGGIDFSLILHLVSASSAETPQMLWGFINKYNSALKPGEIPFLDSMLNCAIRYFERYIKPKKAYRKPSEVERSALIVLKTFLEENLDASAEEIQQKVYAIGMDFKMDLRLWFKAIYEVLLGQDQGPRAGSFIKLYGVLNTIYLIEQKAGL
jgi:lysyl-tRNA synthetase class 1